MADNSLQVCEQFYSIQGESTWAGLPCLFIRLAGCNLRCSYCDSSYTWEEPGVKVSLNEIIAWVGNYPGIMVELTGGEPLLQDGAYLFMNALVEKKRTVLLETNGSILVDRVPPEVNIILDIKCPDSGMESTNNWENIQYLNSRSRQGCRDEVKFVLSSADDFFWARDIVEQYKLNETVTVLFSPNDKSLQPSELAELILQHKLPVRLQLQLHKTLWPDKDRGV